VTYFQAYCDTRTRDEPDPLTQSTWVTVGSKLRVEGYTGKYKQKYGEDADPKKSPFDAEVAMLAGQGRRNGRLWIGDGSVPRSVIPSLSQVRATRTGSNPDIETRPQPSVVAIDEIKVCSSPILST
jgi:hypothetical protein